MTQGVEQPADPGVDESSSYGGALWLFEAGLIGLLSKIGTNSSNDRDLEGTHIPLHWTRFLLHYAHVPTCGRNRWTGPRAKDSTRHSRGVDCDRRSDRNRYPPLETSSEVSIVQAAPLMAIARPRLK